MTDKEKISWRQQAKLWVLQGILLVAAGISLFSTMAGFHTVFFPSSAMCNIWWTREQSRPIWTQWFQPRKTGCSRQ